MIALKLIPISLSELKPLIAYAYEGDTDLIEKYQADNNRTYQQCVDFNYNEIAEMSANPVYQGDIHIWSISLESGEEQDPIGYCVTIENEEKPHLLLSYSINKNYRKAVFLIDWLKAVEEKLGTPYYTSLWNKNERAIDFFVKNGFKPFQSSERESVLVVRCPELLDRGKFPWAFK